MASRKRGFNRVMATALSAITLLGGSATSALYATSIPVFTTVVSAAEVGSITAGAVEYETADDTACNGYGAGFTLQNYGMGVHVYVTPNEKTATLLAKDDKTNADGTLISVLYSAWYYIGSSYKSAKTIENKSISGMTKEELENTFMALPAGVTQIVIKQMVAIRTPELKKKTYTAVSRITDFTPVVRNSDMMNVKLGTNFSGFKETSNFIDSDGRTVKKDDAVVSNGYLQIKVGKAQSSTVEYNYSVVGKNALGADYKTVIPTATEGVQLPDFGTDSHVTLNSASSGYSKNQYNVSFPINLDTLDTELQEYKHSYSYKKDGKSYNGTCISANKNAYTKLSDITEKAEDDTGVTDFTDKATKVAMLVEDMVTTAEGSKTFDGYLVTTLRSLPLKADGTADNEGTYLYKVCDKVPITITKETAVITKDNVMQVVSENTDRSALMAKEVNYSEHRVSTDRAGYLEPQAVLATTYDNSGSSFSVTQADTIKVFTATDTIPVTEGTEKHSVTCKVKVYKNADAEGFRVNADDGTVENGKVVSNTSKSKTIAPTDACQDYNLLTWKLKDVTPGVYYIWMSQYDTVTKETKYKGLYVTVNEVMEQMTFSGAYATAKIEKQTYEPVLSDVWANPNSTSTDKNNNPKYQHDGTTHAIEVSDIVYSGNVVTPTLTKTEGEVQSETLNAEKRPITTITATAGQHVQIVFPQAKKGSGFYSYKIEYFQLQGENSTAKKNSTLAVAEQVKVKEANGTYTAKDSLSNTIATEIQLPTDISADKTYRVKFTVTDDKNGSVTDTGVKRKIAPIVAYCDIVVKAQPTIGFKVYADGVEVTKQNGTYTVADTVSTVKIVPNNTEDNPLSKVYYSYWYPCIDNAYNKTKELSSGTMALSITPKLGVYQLAMLITTKDGRFENLTDTLTVTSACTSAPKYVISGGTGKTYPTGTTKVKVWTPAEITGKDKATVTEYLNKITTGDTLVISNSAPTLKDTTGYTAAEVEAIENTPISYTTTAYKVNKVGDTSKSGSSFTATSTATYTILNGKRTKVTRTSTSYTNMESSYLTITKAGLYRVESTASYTNPITNKTKKVTRYYYITVENSTFDVAKAYIGDSDTNNTVYAVAKNGTVQLVLETNADVTSATANVKGKTSFTTDNQANYEANVDSANKKKVTLTFNTDSSGNYRYWVILRLKDETLHEIVRYYAISSGKHIYKSTTGAKATYRNDSVITSNEDGTMTISYKVNVKRGTGVAQNASTTLASAYNVGVYVRSTVADEKKTDEKLMKFNQVDFVKCSANFGTIAEGTEAQTQDLTTLTLTASDIEAIKKTYGNEVQFLLRERVNNTDLDTIVTYMFDKDEDN